MTAFVLNRVQIIAIRIGIVDGRVRIALPWRVARREWKLNLGGISSDRVTSLIGLIAVEIDE
jgi:hypothetical protein